MCGFVTCGPHQVDLASPRVTGTDWTSSLNEECVLDEEPGQYRITGVFVMDQSDTIDVCVFVRRRVG